MRVWLLSQLLLSRVCVLAWLQRAAARHQQQPQLARLFVFVLVCALAMTITEQEQQSHSDAHAHRFSHRSAAQYNTILNQ